MTDQESLDEIRALLLAYPGVSSAVVIRAPDGEEVHVRFRCTDANSLRSLAASAEWANVVITLGNPNTQLCAEPDDVTDLPCDIEIPDNDLEVPTNAKRFGAYVSNDLAAQRLISEKKRAQLHTRWNTRLAKENPSQPDA